MVAEPKAKPRQPLAAKLKARSLYLIHGLPYLEIAAQTGIPAKTLRNMAVREGWTKSKRGTKERLLRQADARMAEDIAEVSEAIAVESEGIALGSLGRARKCVESDHENAAKDFQAWSGGARNLVNIARACRGLDARNGGADAGASVTNIFAVGTLTFGATQAKPDASEPRNVTPQDATEANASVPGEVAPVAIPTAPTA